MCVTRHVDFENSINIYTIKLLTDRVLKQICTAVSRQFSLCIPPPLFFLFPTNFKQWQPHCIHRYLLYSREEGEKNGQERYLRGISQLMCISFNKKKKKRERMRTEKSQRNNNTHILTQASTHKKTTRHQFFFPSLSCPSLVVSSAAGYRYHLARLSSRIRD